MSHYTRTPRMVTPRLAPQPPPVVYSVPSAPYQPSPAMAPHHQMYRVASSEPSYPRGHHRSSSRSRNHRRSHSSSGGRHRRHRDHRSSTPSHAIPATYSPAVHYPAIAPRQRRHSYSVPSHHRSSTRDPHRSGHYGHHEHHHLSHRGETIGERIKRFFGFGNHGARFVNHHGHEVDQYGRPIYAM